MLPTPGKSCHPASAILIFSLVKSILAHHNDSMIVPFKRPGTNNILKKIGRVAVLCCGWCSSVMIILLDFRSSSPGSLLGQRHCIVYLSMSKTLYSRGVSPTQVYYVSVSYGERKSFLSHFLLLTSKTSVRLIGHGKWV